MTSFSVIDKSPPVDIANNVDINKPDESRVFHEIARVGATVRLSLTIPQYSLA